MFLRSNRRIKDGKEHRYYTVVESRRLRSGKVAQRQVLYLGEINGAAMAVGIAVIPYCFARACSEISGNSDGAAVRELKSLNEKLALISPKPVSPEVKGK